jgi:hypothetical protein
MGLKARFSKNGEEIAVRASLDCIGTDRYFSRVVNVSFLAQECSSGS